MQNSRETKLLNTLCVCLVLFAGIVRLVAAHYGLFSYNTVICALFTVTAFIWIGQLRKRLLQPAVRKNLVAVAVMIIVWMVLRTIKYDFLPETHFTVRYAWYLYYIPMILIPLFLFFSVLYIGRPQNRPISRWWNLLFLPAVALILGVLTNDIHQLAFHFPGGLTAWDSVAYIRGPVYYMAMGWMATLFVAMLILVFFRCRVPAGRRRIWIPMVPLLTGFFYTLGIIRNDSLFTKMLTVPEMSCFLFAAFMESLICVHLFPSNDSYGSFWNASSIGAGIMDRTGVIRYRSAHSLSVTPEQIRKAEGQTVLLQDGNTALRSHAIHGGYGYWLRDLTEINHLNRELADLGDVLAEENAMLDAENRLEENKLSIDKQNRLYDSLARDVQRQLDTISRLLDEPPEAETDFERVMKYVCILGIYIKRRSNLLLLFHENTQINGEELCLAISESLEYVRLYGIRSDGTLQVEGSFPGECILLLYELFEDVLEAALPKVQDEPTGTDAVLVYLESTGGGLSLHMTLNAPRDLPQTGLLESRTAQLHGTLEITTDEQTEYVSLVLPAGGGSG